MKLLKNIYLTGAAVVLLTGCQGDLMDLNPYDSISSGNMWATENLADMGVNGIYNVLRAIFINSIAMVFLQIIVTEIMLF